MKKHDLLIKINFLRLLMGLLLVCLQLGVKAMDLITVDLQGKGDFTSIQEAINSVRAFRGEHTVRIWIKKGIYREKVVIPSYLENVQLVGESAAETKIVYNDYAGKEKQYADETGQTKLGTFTSYTLLVRANHVVIKNLTIENDAGPVGQAVALHIEGDRIALVDCILLGYQDTLYLGREGSRSVFLNCRINGTTDFIFGPGCSFFSKCKLISLRNSYVTAASTPKGQTYGYVFEQCDFIAGDTGVNKVFLGRPWRPYAKTVLVDCNLGKHIAPEGWNEWKGDKLFPEKEKTVYYAELKSKGEGAYDLSKRVAWSHQLPSSSRKDYKLSLIMGNWDVKKMVDDMNK